MKKIKTVKLSKQEINNLVADVNSQSLPKIESLDIDLLVRDLDKMKEEELAKLLVMF